MQEDELQHLNFFVERAQQLKSCYSGFSEDKLIATRMMFEVTKRIELFFESKMSEYGLVAASWPILLMVYSAKDKSMTATEICSTLIQNKSTTSRIVESMMEINLLERNVDANDRRKIDLLLTDDGTKLVEKILPESAELYNQLFCNINLEVFKKDIAQVWLNVQHIKNDKNL